MTPGTQIALKLIEQLPGILTALGVLLTASLGIWNARKLSHVQRQTDGRYTTLLDKNEELHAMTAQLTAALAGSVPASTLVAPVVIDRRSADETDKGRTP